jgi:O-6-methylguanine DNA methyltransferase
MNRKSRGPNEAPAQSKIDVAIVRTRFATFGVASIFPIHGNTITKARAAKDPWLARRMRAGAELQFHRVPRSYPPSLASAVSSLRAFAEGDPRWKLPALDLEGTPFQMSVWKQLCAIPYGKTVSYGKLAASIGKPKAARAVGGAVGSNPVPLLIPCHRVIGEDGSLTGFGLGLPMKKALLSHEGIKKA